jgi:hypothetical protein
MRIRKWWTLEVLPFLVAMVIVPVSVFLAAKLLAVASILFTMLEVRRVEERPWYADALLHSAWIGFTTISIGSILALSALARKPNRRAALFMAWGILVAVVLFCVVVFFASWPWCSGSQVIQ